jgi:hypothetical protein
VPYVQVAAWRALRDDARVPRHRRRSHPRRASGARPHLTRTRERERAGVCSVKPHQKLLEQLKVLLDDTPCGAIIILSERTGGATDVNYISNLSRADQAKVLEEFLAKVDQARGSS